DLREHDGASSADLRRRLAAKGFAHTADYDCAITAYLDAEAATTHGDGGDGGDGLPQLYARHYYKLQDLRYGENPHQAAAVYTPANYAGVSLVAAEQHQGKALSYNNLADADAALACAQAFGEAPACVIVKHANPCGVATGDDLCSAYERA